MECDESPHSWGDRRRQPAREPRALGSKPNRLDRLRTAIAHAASGQVSRPCPATSIGAVSARNGLRTRHSGVSPGPGSTSLLCTELNPDTKSRRRARCALEFGTMDFAPAGLAGTRRSASKSAELRLRNNVSEEGLPLPSILRRGRGGRVEQHDASHTERRPRRQVGAVGIAGLDEVDPIARGELRERTVRVRYQPRKRVQIVEDVKDFSGVKRSGRPAVAFAEPALRRQRRPVEAEAEDLRLARRLSALRSRPRSNG